MALIAPGAFLWLTFYIQATGTTGQPCGWDLCRLLLCLATAVAYLKSPSFIRHRVELLLCEQALLFQEQAFKYARVAKFIVGWGSHLYYWFIPA